MLGEWNIHARLYRVKWNQQYKQSGCIEVSLILSLHFATLQCIGNRRCARRLARTEARRDEHIK